MYEYLQQISLLYVEDDDSIREILAKRLERYVKKLYVATNGEQGLELFESSCVDVVLTDVTMPKMNGIEMAKQMKIKTPTLPIIIVSAHGEVKFLLESIACGVSNYLLKPIEKEKLLTMLEEQAKNVCLSKINEEQRVHIEAQNRMLQNILDAEKSISCVSDFNKLLFANKSFLDFFDVRSIESFDAKYKDTLDIFEPMDEYVHKKLIDNYETLSQEKKAEAFYNLVEHLDETKRMVLILDKQFNPRSFYLSISIIDPCGVYLISLMDITKMTIEKVVTQKKAYTDKLTGLNNRNGMMEFYEAEVERVRRYNHPLCIAVLDIDHFKQFNDTYGHLIGDEVLQMLANSLSNNIRSTDMVARWGGEEFVVIFVETALNNAISTSKMLKDNIEKLEHKIAGKITASFGVTQYNSTDTIETLFERCDKALYQAKKEGRNKVVSM